MEFKVTEIIRHPTEEVYLTYRDRLPQLVPYLPNVDLVEILEKEETDEGPRLLNRWTVTGSIPRTVRPFFKGKRLSYLDRARWNDEESLVHWNIEIGLVPDAVACGGINYFRAGAAPGTTEVSLTGALTVDLSRMAGVPRIFYGIAPKIESFVLDRVKPNLSSVTRAVAQYLDEREA